MKYFIASRNSNSFVEFLRSQKLSSSFLVDSPEDPRSCVLISIDSVNLFELFRPYRRKIYFSLEFSKARKFYWLICLYRFVFDCLFEWELNACGASRSFLPFFPSRVGLLHEVSGIVSTVNPLDFYSTQDFLSLKTRDLSVVVSNKSFLPWQFLRLELIDRLSRTISFDRFGRGFFPIDDKADALLNYRYHLACENCDAGPSEKLWDPLLCSCVVFYAGNISLVHPFLRRAIIPIPLKSSVLTARIISSELTTRRRFKSLDQQYWLSAKALINRLYSFDSFVERNI